ncbi:glycoside hydrolase family 3 C-terminal domain-containing protein [Sanguibacter sp. 25GB23B1]|uniref:glycoside hydrolase family 3 C-terminal domain-containing protein n=1 Tax=unclassified Sanguibacter TaxID=2645534 RepID=UPI0032AFBDAE
MTVPEHAGTTQHAEASLDIEQIVATLTLEEKASMTSGRDFWTTQPVERAGVPSIMVADGPHGLRKQPESADNLGIGGSVPATCFPTATALASTWDTTLLRRVGEALGRETRANDVAVLLGPGINIKRSPLCGRNFEYFSEDPVVSGNLAAALVQGIQSQGVGTSLKHFAVNNQETDRMRVSADVDERTLREIYLSGFERVVTQAAPWTVMCSYNKINGTYASQNRWLLTEVLRDEWGFDGVVMSDWGAVSDRVPALAAGLDLEMPSSGNLTDAEVVAAVRAGELDEAVLDTAVRRLLTLVRRALPAVQSTDAYDVAAHHALAREAAADGAVLLKNDAVPSLVAGQPDAPLLPLRAADAGGVAVLGEFARTPRYQGAGSSQVNPTRIDEALDAVHELTGADIAFAPAFTIDETAADEARDRALLDDAVETARTAHTVVLFLGLPASDESEGYDRQHLDLPANQLAVLRAVAAVNPRVVVVLANGSAVTVAGWEQDAPAILEAWLGGQAGGGAVADLLFGARTPSGRLTETLPLRLEDTPSFGSFPGELGTVRYGEGTLVGYRYYDTKDVAVSYPFGHGLSYTTFDHSTPTATVSGTGADTTVEVTVTVTNTGTVAGAEVVQVYVGDPAAQVQRPVRELKAFRKVTLQPGESQELCFDLVARDLSYWHTGLGRWVLEGGDFVVSVGASSRDLRGSVTVDVVGESLAGTLTHSSTFGEWMAHPVGGPLMGAELARPETIGADADGTLALDETMTRMIVDMPARVIAGFEGMLFGRDALDRLVDEAAAVRD